MSKVKIKPGDKLDIAWESGLWEPCISNVGDVLDENLFLINTPISRGNIIKLPVNRNFTFLFYTQDGLFQAEGTVLGYCVQNKVSLMKVRVKHLLPVERRGLYRLKLVMEFTYSLLKEMEECSPDKIVPEYKGITEDLSGSGLRFLSGEILNVNERVLCRLNFLEEAMILEGEVLFSEKLETREINAYRIKFLNLSSDKQEKLVRFIFSKERESIRKRRPEIKVIK
jgi:Predicted glycosyltransferase